MVSIAALRSFYDPRDPRRDASYARELSSLGKPWSESSASEWLSHVEANYFIYIYIMWIECGTPTFGILLRCICTCIYRERERVYLASFRFIFYFETNMFLVKFCRNLDWWRNHLQTWFRGVWVWRFVDFPPKLLLMCKNWTWCFYLGLDWLREG